MVLWLGCTVGRRLSWRVLARVLRQNYHIILAGYLHSVRLCNSKHVGAGRATYIINSTRNYGVWLTPTTSNTLGSFMKNLTRQKQSKELATQGYQRRYFNESPLVIELAAAFDQAFAEYEQTLTEDDDLDQNGDSDLASPFVHDPGNETRV